MIYNLQILRAVAAIMVIFAHLKFVLPEQAGNMSPLLGGAGLACGVDLFFVLSGFVIAHTAQNSSNGWKQFLTNRIVRVMPLFWLLSLPFLIQAIIGGWSKGDLPFRVFWNSFLLVPLFDKFGINDPVHPFGWTLSFEMWFYVLFSLLLMVIPAKRVPAALITIFLLTSPLPFVWQMSWKFPYFAFHPLCWEFAMGCAAYLITRRIRLTPWQGLLVLLVAMALLGWSAIAFQHLGWHGRIRMEPVLSAQRAILWGVPAFLIVMGCVWSEPLLGWGPVTRFFVGLGGASYATYLTQPLVFEFLSVSSGWLGRLPWQLVAIASVLICISVGWLTHRWVELPLLRWLRSIRGQSKVVVESSGRSA